MSEISERDQEVLAQLGLQLGNMDTDPSPKANLSVDERSHALQHQTMPNKGSLEFTNDHISTEPLGQTGECHGARTKEMCAAWEAGYPQREGALRHIDKCSTCYAAFCQLYGE